MDTAGEIKYTLRVTSQELHVILDSLDNNTSALSKEEGVILQTMITSLEKLKDRE